MVFITVFKAGLEEKKKGGEEFVSEKIRGRRLSSTIKSGAKSFFNLKKGGEDFFQRKNKGGKDTF